MVDRDPRFAEKNQDTPNSSVVGPDIPQEKPLYESAQGQVINNSSVEPQQVQKRPGKQKNALHLLSGFCEYPDKISFHDQEPGEEILLFLRKDFIVNIGWMVISFVLFVAPTFLLILPQSAIPFTIPQNFGIILLLFYYLVTFTYAFINFFIWYYNAALITTKRLIDIDFHQLIYKDIAQTKLSLVQDVSFRQQSVLENFFDFGHVLIQTAGTIDNFEFDALPKPDRVEEIVDDLIGKGRTYVP